jgi:TPR repeat protein
MMRCLHVLITVFHLLIGALPDPSYDARLIDRNLQVAFGGDDHGLTSQLNSISDENLQKILDGFESGNKESVYFFGILKMYGISLPKDTAAAVQSFKTASEMGHAEAATALGVMYMTGVGTERDPTLAASSFRHGITLGDRNAGWLLAK